MRFKANPKPYIFLFVVILALLSLPKSSSEKMRGVTIAAFSPLWETLSGIQKKVYSVFGNLDGKNRQNQQLQRLELERHHLQSEVNRLEKLLIQEQSLDRQLSQFKPSKTLKNLKKRHKDQLKHALAFQFQAIPAEVIFRSPSSWNSSLWINVGKEDNQKLGSEIISRNSPVVVGTSVIGVIDYVGNRQSRVRLITDSGLTPAVRVLRGSLRKKFLEEHLAALVDQIMLYNDSSLDPSTLNKLQVEWQAGVEEESWLLAKGELQGNSLPLWRSLGNRLKGVGFNYDFSDEEGEARDLRSATLKKTDKASTTILQKDDLLVTSGMDGVFPAGLHVAIVTEIRLLREGDYYYELEAVPTAGNLQEITSVFVMPALGYDDTDQPNPHEIPE